MQSSTHSPATDGREFVWEGKVVRALGANVIVRKCYNDHVRKEDGSVLVHIPDGKMFWCNWVEIVAVGPKCREIFPEHVGGMVWCLEVNGITKLGKALYSIPESLLLPEVAEANKPIGLLFR